MQIFNPAVITKKGLELLFKAQTGQCEIQFIGLGTGNGEYTAAEKVPETLQNRTTLKNKKNQYAASNISVQSENVLKIKTLITNQDPDNKAALVTEGYYINEIGLYAKEKNAANSEIILYSISVCSGSVGDYMPAFTGYNPATIIQEYYATVSNSLEVDINYEGAFYPAEDGQALEAILQPTAVSEAFCSCFTYLDDDEEYDTDVMSDDDIETIIESTWDGSTTSDPHGLDKTQIAEILAIDWDGSSTTDPNAMSKNEINNILT